MIRIPTRTHGIMDLVYSAAFLSAPFILSTLTSGDANGRKKSNGNNDRGIEDILLPAIGGSILAQGLMTDHELGAVKALPMRAHLAADLGLGALMIAAPFVFKLHKRLKVPLIALGAVGIGLALLTQTESSSEEIDDLVDDNETLAEEIIDLV